ncbi:MAG TPA: hypothetical protein VMD91_04985 [Candidatus Sulfotelmatobacter sp.]|nr:hypothetical protein [Candidatus Sulfotelmatobacter sp.]
MIPADVAFRLACNAAAAAYAQAPPYLAYRTTVTVDVPSLNRHESIARAVETRTADDFASLQDLPRGQHQYGHSFPMPPTFDALSYFNFVYSALHRNALAYVQQVEPITFKEPAHADVIVTALRYYHADYAPDSNDKIAHIVMDPLPSLTTGNNSTFYLHDVYVDTATNLPTSVTYTGPTQQMTVDYTTVDGHWLVRHAVYNATFYAVLHLGRISAHAEATNEDFTFPTTPTDPKLAAPPQPTPTPKR